MHWKKMVPILVVALLASFGCAAYLESPTPPGWHAQPRAGLPPFYDDLSPWGEWLRVEPWGWVWSPWDMEPGWRPYTHGRWALTGLGWTWVSDWPWGWAPFHYGRWTYHSYYGWLWVPGTVWAPAWVAWRYGNGWIGWAPLPPDVHWRFGFGLDLGGLNLDLVIAEHGWCFVDEHSFLAPRVWNHLAPLPRHRWLLRETRDRTRYEEREHQVTARPFGVEELEPGVGAVPRYDIEELERPPDREEGIRGGTVRVYRPKLPETPEPPGEIAPAGREPVQPPQAPGRQPSQPSQPSQPPPTTARPRERQPAVQDKRDERELKAWERQQQESLEREQKLEAPQPARRRDPAAGRAAPEGRAPGPGAGEESGKGAPE